MRKKRCKRTLQKGESRKIADFSGISSPYEAPEAPDIEADTTGRTIEETADYIYSELKKHL